MPSDDIARLYDFTANTTIQSGQVDGEFDQIISTINNKFGRSVANTLTGNNTFSGTNTFSGVTTFSSGTTPVRTDKVDEYTPAAGVTVDSVLLKDGMVTVSGTPASAGQIGYASNVLTFYNGSAVKTLATTDSASNPKGYINGPAPVYASAATVTFKTGLRARNSANTADIELTGDVTVSLASSGAAGLDTGAEASNTWYYFYLIRKSSDGTCSVVASVTNEAVSGSITYPSGYDQKRQLPFAVRNDGSSNIIPFYCVGGWGALWVMYDVSFSDCNLNTLGTTNVVNANTSTSFVSYSCASFIPPISRAGVFQSAVSSASFVRVRPAGASHQGIAVNGNVGVNSGNFECRTDSSQQIEVAELTATGATNRIDVVGYIVTEMQ